MNKRHYPYAVMDMNRPSDVRSMPWSVHHSAMAALKEANKQNRRDLNAHYIAVHWDRPSNAREFWEDLYEIGETLPR